MRKLLIPVLVLVVPWVAVAQPLPPEEATAEQMNQGTRGDVYGSPRRIKAYVDSAVVGVGGGTNAIPAANIVTKSGDAFTNYTEVVFGGDSHMGGVAWRALGWHLSNAFSAFPNFRYRTNFAEQGHFATNHLTQYDTSRNEYRAPGAGTNGLFVYWGGWNDASGSRTSTVPDVLDVYFSLLRSNGWKVLTFSVPGSDWFHTNTTANPMLMGEFAREQINRGLRRSTNFNWLVDVDALLPHWWNISMDGVHLSTNSNLAIVRETLRILSLPENKFYPSAAVDSDLYGVRAQFGSVVIGPSNSPALGMGPISNAPLSVLGDVQVKSNVYARGFAGDASALTGDDETYDASGWNGDTTLPTKNAVRDKIESLSVGSLPMFEATQFATQNGATNLSDTVISKFRKGWWRIVIDGDSHMAGAVGARGMHFYFTNEFMLTNWSAVSVAVGSMTVSNRFVNWTNNVLPYAPAGGTNTVVLIITKGSPMDTDARLIESFGFLSNYVALCTGAGIPVIVGTYPDMGVSTIAERQKIPDYNRLIMLDTNRLFYDVVPVRERVPDNSTTYTVDGIHWNDVTAYKVASWFADTMKEPPHVRRESFGVPSWHAPTFRALKLYSSSTLDPNRGLSGTILMEDAVGPYIQGQTASTGDMFAHGLSAGAWRLWVHRGSGNYAASDERVRVSTNGAWEFFGTVTITNLSPSIATNNASASNGDVLVKSGNNLRLESMASIAASATNFFHLFKTKPEVFTGANENQTCVVSNWQGFVSNSVAWGVNLDDGIVTNAVAGNYLVSFTASANIAADTDTGQELGLYRNGALVSPLVTFQPGDSGTNAILSTGERPLTLAAGDYLQVKAKFVYGPSYIHSARFSAVQR